MSDAPTPFSVVSDDDPALAQPMLDGLKIVADYIKMRWGGSLLGYGNRPGDILADARGLASADGFFQLTMSFVGD